MISKNTRETKQRFGKKEQVILLCYHPSKISSLALDFKAGNMTE